MDYALVLFIIGLLWIRPSWEGSLTGELPVRGPSKTIVIPRLCSHFLSCIFALNFVPTPDLCPSPPIYTFVSMGHSWWGNIWSIGGSLHLGVFTGRVCAQPGLNSTLLGRGDFDPQPTRLKFQIKRVGSYRFSGVNRSVSGFPIHWFLAEI